MYKVIVFLNVLTILMVGCNNEENDKKFTVQHQKEIHQTEESKELDHLKIVEKEIIYDGLAVFNRSCTACHENIQIVASNLPNGTNLEQVETIITNGYGNMPSFSSILNKSEVEAVAKEILKIAPKS